MPTWFSNILGAYSYEIHKPEIYIRVTTILIWKPPILIPFYRIYFLTPKVKHKKQQVNYKNLYKN